MSKKNTNFGKDIRIKENKIELFWLVILFKILKNINKKKNMANNSIKIREYRLINLKRIEYKNKDPNGIGRIFKFSIKGS